MAYALYLRSSRVAVHDSIEASYEDWVLEIRDRVRLEGHFSLRHIPRQSGISGAVRFHIQLSNVRKQ
jgi:hypothetical protein